jgi:phosphomannomutase
VAISKSDKKLSEIVDELPQYPFQRVKADCPDEKKFEVIERLKSKLSKKYKNVNTIDGVRVDFDHGWILIRASNTGPVIRLSVEADDKKKLNELTEEFLGLLKQEIS